MISRITFLLLIVFGYTANAQNTAIPDANFEQKLIDLGYDTAPIDGQVLTASIEGIKDLTLDDSNIVDLTGINDFVGLEYLYVYFNQITDLTISLPNLMALGASFNEITNVDISGSPNLWAFVCDGNLLTTIDLSPNAALEEVYLRGNNLSGPIDFSSNTHLLYLEVTDNDISAIDLRNRVWTLFEFDATNNPSLECVLVDDASDIPVDWVIDGGAVFVDSEDECPLLGINDQVITLNAVIYPNPVKDAFSIDASSYVTEVTLFDMSGRLVASFIPQANYSLNGVSAGVYFVRITSDQGYKVIKLVVQ